VQDVRHAELVRKALAGQDHRRVRVDQRRAPAAGEGFELRVAGSGHPPRGARPQLCAAQHGQARHDGLDAGFLQEAGELSALREHCDRREAIPVEPGRKRQQEPVRAIAAGRGVQEEDRFRRHIS
jgi:hypothetical protein